MDEIIDLLDSAAKSYPIKAFVKEFGEQMEAISKSIADGRVSRSEAKKCVKEVGQAITALARIKMCLEGFTGERP